MKLSQRIAAISVDTVANVSAAIGALLVFAALVSCSSPTSPAIGRYTLATVADAPVPALTPTVLVRSGVLQLDGGRFAEIVSYQLSGTPARVDTLRGSYTVSGDAIELAYSDSRNAGVISGRSITVTHWAMRFEYVR